MTAETWIAIADIALVAVALSAAVIAFRQLHLARQAREDQVRPFVVVDIVSSPAWVNILNLVVENVGLTLARDIHISFTPELQTSRDGYDLADSPLIRSGISSLPPRRRVTAFVDLFHERQNAGLPLTYDVTVKYSNAHGRPQPPLRYTIDMGVLYGLRNFAEYGIHDVAKALRDINAKLDRWTGSSGRLNVWVRDEDEARRKELEELEELNKAERTSESETAE